MGETQRYRVKGAPLAWEEFPDEVVAIDLDQGVYYSLEAGGAEVWRALAHGATVDEVTRQLEPLYEAPTHELHEAVAGLIADLLNEGLVVAIHADQYANGKRLKPLGSEAEAPARRPLSGFAFRKYDDLQALLVIDPVHDAADDGWPVGKE